MSPTSKKRSPVVQVPDVLVQVALLAFLGLFLSACSNPSVHPAFADLDLTADDDCGATWVAGVTGRIVDEGGLPQGALAQMCIRTEEGFRHCVAPEAADEHGTFAQVVPRRSRCMDEVAMRVVFPGTTFGTTYCRIPLSDVGGLLHIEEPFVLYRTEGAQFADERNVDGTHPMTFADGLQIDLVPEDFGGTFEQIRGARVMGPTCFTEGPFDGLYVLTPELRPQAARGYNIRIPTTLNEGTSVDLFVLGGLEEFPLGSGEVLEEGAFVRFGAGTVEEGHVRNDPGSELPYFSWFGYRRAER